MREARARGGRGCSRDSNGVGFADASAISPIARPIVFARGEVSVRQADNILGWQVREFVRHFYGSWSRGFVCSGEGEGELFDGDVESAEVVSFAEDEAAGHGVDGESDKDAYPCGAVAESEAEEVPVICDPAPELLERGLAFISPQCFRSVKVGGLGYSGSRVGG